MEKASGKLYRRDLAAEVYKSISMRKNLKKSNKPAACACRWSLPLANFASALRHTVHFASVEMMTSTMGSKPCTDLIPFKPRACDGEEVSQDCWDACRSKHGPSVAAGCVYEPLLPGLDRACTKGMSHAHFQSVHILQQTLLKKPCPQC
ncbi:hypothetical protein LXL04_001032 [Taraxacum kok-saghyz]